MELSCSLTRLTSTRESPSGWEGSGHAPALSRAAGTGCWGAGGPLPCCTGAVAVAGRVKGPLSLGALRGHGTLIAIQPCRAWDSCCSCWLLLGELFQAECCWAGRQGGGTRWSCVCCGCCRETQQTSAIQPFCAGC